MKFKILRCFVASLLLAAAGLISACQDKTGANGQKEVKERQTPAFGELVHIEKVRLTEPMEFVVEGVPRRETDVVLLAVRVSDPGRFLPRGDLGERFVLGGVQARGLVPPIFSPIVVVAVPAATPQPPDALWLAPGAVPVERLKQEDVQVLYGAASLLPLGPEAIETFNGTPAHTLADRAGLASYTKELSRKLEAR